MIAKVMSSGASMASAVGYNEDKVQEGEAVVIAEVNADSDHTTVLDTFSRLENMNIRSKEVSFHMSVNPSETERLSESQVKELVGELMNGLGYGSQPYIIYRHDDIGRTHYHVVSIRIDHEGRKIPSRQERRQCNELLKGMTRRFGIRVGNGTSEALSVLGIDVSRFRPEAGHTMTQIEAITQDCLSYRYVDMDQFKTLMRSRGIEVTEGRSAERPVILIGLNSEGKRCTPPIDERSLSIPVRESCEHRITECANAGRAPVREAEKICRIAGACLPHASDVASFVKMMDRKGITVDIRRDASGKISGVVFIDRQSHCVLGASQLRTFKVSDLRTLDSGPDKGNKQRDKGNAPSQPKTIKNNEQQNQGKAKPRSVKR